MVEFNKLFVIPCNKGIYIDCSVLDMPYFNNVYIDKIVVDTQDTFSKDGVSKYPVYSYTISGNQKRVQMTIKATDDLNIMFFCNFQYSFIEFFLLIGIVILNFKKKIISKILMDFQKKIKYF